MNQKEQDLESLRDHITKSLSGDLGDEAQEEMLINLFKGHLRHQMGLLNVWAGENVGTLKSGRETLIWG